MVQSQGFSRAWCFTTYSWDDVQWFIASDPRAIVIAKEVGEHGKEHYQGYVRWNDKKRFSALKKSLSDTAHFEIRKGSEKDAWQYIADVEAYLKKPGSHQKTQGEIIIDKGCSKEVESKGDETDQVLDMLEAGCPRHQIYREHRRFYFHQARKIRELDEEMRAWDSMRYEYKRRRVSDEDEEA